MSSIRTASRDDILRWPDGTTCYRWEWERGDYAWMSDDFEVITTESPEYDVIQRGGMNTSLETCEAMAIDPPRMQAAGYRPKLPVWENNYAAGTPERGAW